MSEAVLLLVERTGNRRQLDAWIREERGLHPAGTDEHPDLVVADGPGLAARRHVLEAERERGTPVFLPCLLVVPARDARLVTPELWRVVDDVVTTPLRPEELRLRTDRLLARRRAARDEAARTEELRRSNTDLERFAFVAAHELRSPLAIVGGFVETLSRRYRGVLEDGASVLLDEALEGCRRMSVLVDDVLAYSRVGRRLDVSELDVSEVVREALAELRSDVEDSGAEVEIGELPAVRADRSMLRLVFRNLLANGIKFRRPGQAPRIVVSAEPGEDEWVFCVADDGIGIPPAEAQRIFEIFERGRDGVGYSGSGIGLATCRRVVGELGGRIWCSPGERNGAVFRFTIPAGGTAPQTAPPR